MKRITISLPQELSDLLADDARRSHRSVSDVAREAIAEHLGVAEGCEPRAIPFSGLGQSGHGDIAENFDRYLRASWASKLAADVDET